MSGRRPNDLRARPHHTPIVLDPGAFKRPCLDCGKLKHISQFARVGNITLRICKPCSEKREVNP